MCDLTTRDRLVAVTLLALLWVCLAACSRDRNADHVAEATPGVTDTTVTVGSSLALSGHAGYLGRQTLAGAMAYIQSVNAAGGVHGRTIRVIALDDGYDPPRCVANTQKLLIEDQVFCLFCYVGTPTTSRSSPCWKKPASRWWGVFTGADALRVPFRRLIVNIRASYYQETAAAVAHMVGDLDLSRVAVSTSTMPTALTDCAARRWRSRPGGWRRWPGVPTSGAPWTWRRAWAAFLPPIPRPSS